MAGVFISYRRSDSAGHAGHLASRLRWTFTRWQVFIDAEGGIPKGANFSRIIEKALGRASALVVVIGKRWLEPTRSGAPCRLWDPGDWVHNEIAAALGRGILVLPVLVDGAVMPAEADLPPTIAPLAKREFVELRGSSWSRDAREVRKALMRVIPLNVRNALLGAGGLAALALAIPTRDQVILEKVAGEGISIPSLTWNDKNKFVVRALDLNRQPVVGAKIAWRTEFCSGAYVGETDDKGLSSASILCNIERKPRTYYQSAQPVSASAPIGLILSDKQPKPIGRPVEFQFVTPKTGG